MNWQQQQQQFWEWISKPQDLTRQDEQISALLAPHSQVSSTEALGVYHNAFHMRLLQVSSEMLPVVYNTLGEEVYTAMFLGYLDEHLPRPGPMHLMLEDLESWLRSHPEFGRLPALLDIVHVEILLIRLFDVADEPVFTLPALQAIPADEWAGIPMQPRPDWSLFSSRFNLQAYWQQMNTWYSEGGTAGEAGFGVPLVNPDQPETCQDYLLMRYRQRMQIRPITPALRIFLEGVQQEQDFAGVCEYLDSAFPEADIPRLSLELLLQALQLELLSSSAAAG